MSRAELPAAALCEVVQNIWETMFSMGLETVDENFDDRARFVTSCVQISGAWEGVVVLRSSLTLARRLTGIMLDLQEPQGADLCDAMGELANLTAGGVQALLPAPSELTPPVVIEGKDYTLVFPRCSIVNEVHFRLQAEALTVTLFEANHDACPKMGGEPRCTVQS